MGKRVQGLPIGDGKTQAHAEIDGNVHFVQPLPYIYRLTVDEQVQSGTDFGWKIKDVADYDIQILAIKLFGVFQDKEEYVTTFTVENPTFKRPIPEVNTLPKVEKRSSSIDFNPQNFFLSNNSIFKIKTNFNVGGAVVYYRLCFVDSPDNHPAQIFT